MKHALIVAAMVLGGGAGEARADVFVPADPRPRAAECVGAAGDLVVSSRRAGTRRVVAASRAGGPWRRVAGLDGCPVVAAAPDGTAAVVAYAETGMRMIVRRPGGEFGAPIALGGSLAPPAVAAGPGGWVVAAWVQDRPSSRTSTLTAVVVRPDGTSTRAVLDRAGKAGTRFADLSPPRAGIGAGGTAIVAWARSSLSTRRQRSARATGGGGWSIGADLAGGAAGPAVGGGAQLRAGPPAVAVAPGGRTLIAWAATDGIRAALDGEAPVTVAAETDAQALTAAVNDGGGALIAFANAFGAVAVADRGAGGAWAPAHSLSGAAPPGDAPPEGPFIGTDESGDVPLLLSALTPDGRTTVSWPVSPTDQLRIVAAAGRAGGAWAPGRPVSAVTPFATSSSLALDAASLPRLVWAETAEGAPAGRLRGAQPVDDALAPPPDSTAPVLQARWPANPPATRGGPVELRVRMRCSERCDARLLLTYQGRDVDAPKPTRRLAPGRDTTVRLTLPASAVRGFLAAPRTYSLRLQLDVADRAGNVTQSAHTIRLRVVKIPLRAFKVGPRHDFGMFSAAGDRAVGRVVNALIDALASNEIRSQRELDRRYLAAAEAIVRAGHAEVSDTAVGDEIFAALEPPLRRSGYDAEAMLGQD